MKLTEIPSPVPCKTIEYLLEAFDMRFSFQVYEGKVEHADDYVLYGWSRGSTIEEVVEWTKQKEKEDIERLKAHKRAVIVHKNRTPEQKEEYYWQIIKNDPYKVWEWNQERAQRLGMGQYEEDSNQWEFFDEYVYRQVEDYTEDQKLQMLHEEENKRRTEQLRIESQIKGYDYPKFI